MGHGPVGSEKSGFDKSVMIEKQPQSFIGGMYATTSRSKKKLGGFSIMLMDG